MADDERLEELEEHIKEARAHAREALGEPDPKEREFYESGDDPESKEQDDQTIAPPG
jgi:hypothetical protein